MYVICILRLALVKLKLDRDRRRILERKAAGRSAILDKLKGKTYGRIRRYYMKLREIAVIEVTRMFVFCCDKSENLVEQFWMKDIVYILSRFL